MASGGRWLPRVVVDLHAFSLSLTRIPLNRLPSTVSLFLFFFLSPPSLFFSLFRSSSPSSPPFLTEPRSTKRERVRGGGRERERRRERESEGGPGWDCVFEINHPPRRRGAAATCAPTILLKHNVTRNDVKIWRGLGITRTPACIREPPTTFIPFPLPARSYRQWILAGSLRAIEYQAKWKENEKKKRKNMYSSDISIFRHRYLLLFVPLFAIEIADYSNVESFKRTIIRTQSISSIPFM